jgi:serine protease Do
MSQKEWQDDNQESQARSEREEAELCEQSEEACEKTPSISEPQEDVAPAIEEEREATVSAPALQREPSAAEPYLYRWNYADQKAFEQKEQKKKRASGAWVFALGMVLAFGLCISLLAGVLLWYNATGRAELADGSLTTGEVAEIVNPSVVLIYSKNESSFGYGTGFFIRSDGYIATNYHVVEGYRDIEVTLYSAKRLPATLVGYNKDKDLAGLKIEGRNYAPISIGDSNTVAVGDSAIVIGHPSGAGGAWTVTQGIISALGRQVSSDGTANGARQEMIQTDAAVNAGNSGGPLCNDRAEVIGVITKKMTDHEGFGLAIPINEAMEVLNELLEKGPRPVIGVSGYTVTEGTTYSDGTEEFLIEHDGFLVSEITADSGAEGVIYPQDIIIAMDGEAVKTANDLLAILEKHKVGDSVQITVIRQGEQMEVTVILGE